MYSGSNFRWDEIISSYIDVNFNELTFLVLFILGALLLRLYLNEKTTCVECAERISKQANKCKHCGSLQKRRTIPEQDR
jgi:ribosomal protein L40E